MPKEFDSILIDKLTMISTEHKDGVVQVRGETAHNDIEDKVVHIERRGVIRKMILVTCETQHWIF